MNICENSNLSDSTINGKTCSTFYTMTLLSITHRRFSVAENVLLSCLQALLSGRVTKPVNSYPYIKLATFNAFLTDLTEN